MNIYISTNYRALNPIQEALGIISDRLKIQIIQADYLNIEEQIIPQIIDTIKKTDVVIADISNESPNVYYEIGIAHALGKAVILVSQTNNFSKFSLLSSRFYNYDIDAKGIKNLSFWLEQMLIDKEELNKLRPLFGENNILNFQESEGKNRLNEILNLSGSAKYYQLENWLYSLLKEIPGFDIQYNVSRNGAEYDFILWNSNESKELKNLGNPIPIEVKASKIIDRDLILSLIGKVTLQGFKSFILITTADLTKSNIKLIRDLKINSGIIILIIGKQELEKINSSKDLLKSIIKSFREFVIY